MPSPFELLIHSLPNYETTESLIEASAEEAGLDELDDDIEFVGPLTVEIEAFRDEDEAFVTINAEVDARMECGRCLEPMPQPLSTRFQILYRRKKFQPDWIEDEGEVGLGYYDEGIIDIREDVRRYLQLEIPLWPVCDEACRGLCKSCGASLNDGACACEQGGSGGKRTRMAEQLDKLFNA